MSYIIVIPSNPRPMCICIYECRKQSPLEEAVKADRKDLIHLMVIELGFDIESQSHYLQEPALFTAISKGDKG